MVYFLSIQYLRALASLMVVVFHVGLFLPVWSFETGAAGVDIFFVISGFVMYQSGRSLRPGAFLRHRLIRIVPLYWLVTLAVVAWAGWAIFGTADILRTLFFIAYEAPQNTPPVSPILSVGWTLNLEMMFYLCFALALAIKPKWVVPILVVLMFTLAAIGKTVPGLGPVAKFYTSGIIVEFAAGLVIAQAVDKRWLRLAPSVGIVLLLAGIALFIWPLSEGFRVVSWGIPSVLIVLGSVAIEPVLARFPVRAAALLGDSSYALYLTHLITIGAIVGLIGNLGMSSSPVVGVIIVLLCIPPSIVLHLVFEKPVTRILRSATGKIQTI